ncbi:hypothetical protein Q8W71_31245 [Methylobacterium sp. NEAU 140]|uniref:hypothetical protein n=1 Tax=Methylobacterium sp. NEAU 140 TaxID=3064945 RepID=UPI0027359AF4|nr:hypothetical protein [Methylobacterium sp. NEAU 140]MDP4027068.1 hypothetical protein [Methylobacterium sp. NEAU 140]
MTTTRITTLAAAFAFAFTAAALSPAVAAPRSTTWTGFATDSEVTGAIDPRAGGFLRNPATCPMSSAAEGNARQQNFPVQQYGQTSGGNRC